MAKVVERRSVLSGTGGRLSNHVLCYMKFEKLQENQNQKYRLRNGRFQYRESFGFIFKFIQIFMLTTYSFQHSDFEKDDVVQRGSTLDMGYLAGLFISLGFMVGITVLVGVSKTYSTDGFYVDFC